MSRRLLLLSTVLLLFTTGAFVTLDSAAAQATEGYRPPRTADGQPDLQGFWSNQTYTPLERAEGVDTEFFTQEELASIASGRAGRESAQTEPGTIPDVHYDFTQFGLDRSQAAQAENFRTSLIVDPPHGRLPSMNAAGTRLAAERARPQRGEQRRAARCPLRRAL